MKRLSNLSNAVLYPTPGTTGLSNGSGNCEKANRLFKDGAITEEERKAFRAGNGGKLNPDWVDWLMGWPIGWEDLKPLRKEVFDLWLKGMNDGTWWDTDPADTGEIPRAREVMEHRKDRLRAIGNGQVPLCAMIAQETLCDICGGGIR